MSLNYKIYWIDDDEDLPQSLREQLEIEFSDAFVFDVEIDGDGENLENKLASEPIDLLILDWNINGEKNGLQLVEELRASGELTEIIFYSQDADVIGQCRDLMGVHTCLKSDASDKIRLLINRFQERTKNVAIMRGMIISEAIDLENRLTDLIIALFGTKSDLFKDRILNKPILDFGKKHAFLSGVLKDKITELRKIDKPDAEKITNLEAIKSTLDCMLKEVVNQRNILAHSKKKFDNGVLVLASINKDPPIRFDDDWKNRSRSNIKKHLANLVDIKKALIDENMIVD